MASLSSLMTDSWRYTDYFESLSDCTYAFNVMKYLFHLIITKVSCQVSLFLMSEATLVNKGMRGRPMGGKGSLTTNNNKKEEM